MTQDFSTKEPKEPVKAIFDTRPDTGYDDEIAIRYQFPNRYLTEALKALDDWIIYREPRRGGGRMAYVGAARVKQIKPDPSNPDCSYALLTHFLPFHEVVPLRENTGYYETRLERVQRPDRIGVALQGKSVRAISDAEFGSIARAGFPDMLDSAKQNLSQRDVSQAAEDLIDFAHAPAEEQERRIVHMLVNRPFRDAAFRKSVVRAYGGRCAVTGLHIVNGGGRVEVQAAHIWSVAEGGPDIVQNGIALSATCHWLFDRYLICLTDSYRLLVSHNRVPEDLRNLFVNQGDQIHLPADRSF